MTHTPHSEQDPSLEVIPSTQAPYLHVGEPVLPYGTTNPSSGYSGTDTSAERARRDDSTGVTGARQSKTFMALNRYGEAGLTWKELAYLEGWHHGQASGALSNLHKAGSIARLSERRDRCKVYVLPEYVNGREIEPCAARGAGLPHRGDAVEAWIKAHRDAEDLSGPLDVYGPWDALDALLDEYRLAADTGQTLAQIVKGDDE
jgi:hypothetical protein